MKHDDEFNSLINNSQQKVNILKKSDESVCWNWIFKELIILLKP